MWFYICLDHQRRVNLRLMRVCFVLKSSVQKDKYFYIVTKLIQSYKMQFPTQHLFTLSMYMYMYCYLVAN